MKRIFMATLFLFVASCATVIKEDSLSSFDVENKYGKAVSYEVARINEDDENYYNLAIKIPQDYVFRPGSYSKEVAMDTFILGSYPYKNWTKKLVLMRDLNEKSYVKNIDAYAGLRDRNFSTKMKVFYKKMERNKSDILDKLDSIDLLYDFSDGYLANRIYEGKTYFWTISFQINDRHSLVNRNELLGVMDKFCKIVVVKKSLISEEVSEADLVREWLRGL